MPIPVSERKFMKNKKIIGLTLLSAFLISGCTNANGETTPIKDSTNTTIDTESAESESYQYYSLPDGTLSIAVGTNKHLQYLTIPKMHHGKMVTQITENGFANCIELKQINLPDSINVIREKAFSGCSSLDSIKIPDGTYVIGNYAFEGCSSLTSIVIPEGVTSIGYNAFSGCSSLTSVVIPDSVTSIGGYVFSGCTFLTSVVIPKGVTTIGEYAFDGCSSLTIYCAAETRPEGWDSFWNKINQNGYVRTEWGCEGGGIYLDLVYRIDIINGERVATIVQYRGTESKLMIPGVIEGTKVVGIGNSAFGGCTSLASVTIPDSVTSIGESAFYGCSSLASVVIPKGVTSIGEYAFEGCSSLTSVVIPDSVTSIGYQAFFGCTSLTSVTIPDSVTSIGESAFHGCSSLTIYCAAETEPEGWNYYWNSSDCPVVWGYKSKP